MELDQKEATNRWRKGIYRRRENGRTDIGKDRGTPRKNKARIEKKGREANK